jgi:hypothetical protein
MTAEDDNNHLKNDSLRLLLVGGFRQVQVSTSHALSRMLSFLPRAQREDHHIDTYH